MTSLTRHLASQLRSWAYWQLMNKLRGTEVEGGGVSPKAQIGRRAIVRRGSEVGADVVLGDYSYISGPRSYIEAARIGKFCSIARQVIIGPGDHDIHAVTTHPFPRSPAYGGLARVGVALPQKSPPVIGNDVWIGINSIVMRGVTIGNGAVIAANSVVTRDVAPYSIVGGIPARHLKQRFAPATQEALEKCEWWNWPDDKIAKNIDDFLTPEHLLARNRE